MGEAWKLGYTGNNILILQSEADSSETLKLPTSFTVVATTTIDGQFSSSSYAGIMLICFLHSSMFKNALEKYTQTCPLMVWFEITPLLS